MSVENNQDLELLKEEALDLGIEFSDRIGYDTLKKRVDDRLEELAKKQKESKKAKEAVKTEEKIKIVVEPRDGDVKQVDQFFGFNGKNILIKFGEEVEVDKTMYNFIKNIGGYIQVKTKVIDAEGIPRNSFKKKWKSRFLVERVD